MNDFLYFTTPDTQTKPGASPAITRSPRDSSIAFSQSYRLSRSLEGFLMMAASTMATTPLSIPQHLSSPEASEDTMFPTPADVANGHHMAANDDSRDTSCCTSQEHTPASNNTSSFTSSPRQYPSELPDPILEEGGESGSESPIEPVTPISGRHSQDFTALQNHEDATHQHSHHRQTDYSHPHSDSLRNSQDSGQILQPLSHQSPPIPYKPGLFNARHPVPQPLSTSLPGAPPRKASNAATPVVATPTSVAGSVADQDQPAPPSLSRRSTRGSTSSFKRTMSNLFRRSNSHGKDALMFGDPFSNEPSIDVSQVDGKEMKNGQLSYEAAKTSRRPSMNPSTNTARSNSPTSNGHPLEMASTLPVQDPSAPEPAELKKKSRAATGLTLRGRRIGFATTGRGGRNNKSVRRINSFDSGSPHPSLRLGEKDKTYPPERQPWALPPDAGTGAKARRMSLSLPDDFTLDVADLTSEFEYQSKFLGRHGKHLGKGAASKVTLMARKGYPGELYAVKEFRGKSNRETQKDYDNKIKSEYSIAKSLHHPNIVETIRLCTDHSRWNHVMEYCSEGDLFNLVSKGHLKGDDGRKDRMCLFKQLVQGIAYLHAHGIAHRDIKLENLLITKDSKLKITDFGVSEVFCGTHPGLRESGGQCGQNMGEVRLCAPGICGSEPYIAPEVLAKKEKYDPRALDVWSSAIIMIYMTFGGAIWSRAEGGHEHYDKLVEGWRKWYKKNPEPDAAITDSNYPHCLALDVGITPPALRRVLLQMLNPDPAKRINIVDVINNRWVKNIECCQLESYDDPALLIDATKKDGQAGTKKIFCHSHLPPKAMGSHSLGKMPGSAGY